MGVYDSVLVCEMENFGWFRNTVVQGGCPLILDDDAIRLRKLVNTHMSHNNLFHVLEILGGVGNKTIAQCLFDFTNAKNPNGVIIGPGNSIGFQNIMLSIFGAVSENFKKLIKNHACIHDACGFLLRHLGIGPDSVYAIPKCFMSVSSAGRKMGRFKSFLQLVL